MAEYYGLPPLPPFDPHSDVTSAPTRWKQWIQRFHNFTVAFKVEAPTQKRAMLLHYAGAAVYGIFQTLSETGEDKDFDLAAQAYRPLFVWCAVQL